MYFFFFFLLIYLFILCVMQEQLCKAYIKFEIHSISLAR
jgi:hypothetical protein